MVALSSLYYIGDGSWSYGKYYNQPIRNHISRAIRVLVGVSTLFGFLNPLIAGIWGIGDALISNSLFNHQPAKPDQLVRFGRLLSGLGMVFVGF